MRSDGWDHKVIALEARLRGCRNVLTLGVRTNFSDYPAAERALIRQAEKIYYPTSFYADLFDACGKATFPAYHNYKCGQDKIKQTVLFEMLKIPHPRTRIFYGRRQQSKITEKFDFPFIGKIARGSAMGRGVFLIRDQDDLCQYLRLAQPAYIQEYLPVDRDMRVVIIGHRIVHAYWRVAPPNEFRSNVAVGASISLDPLPSEAKDLALHTARSCGWNDVGIDICRFKNGYYVFEANMKYGRAGFKAAGINYFQVMEDLIAKGEI